jgi:hypothetical protein
MIMFQTKKNPFSIGIVMGVLSPERYGRKVRFPGLKRRVSNFSVNSDSF